VGLGLLGSDLVAVVALLADLEELLAGVTTLRIDIVLPVAHELELLGDIGSVVLPGLVTGVGVGEVNETSHGQDDDGGLLELEVPGPIGLGLLGLHLEGVVLLGALLEELLAVVAALREHIVLPVLQVLELLGTVSAVPGLISVARLEEGFKDRHR